jgi:hypothetical protein
VKVGKEVVTDLQMTLIFLLNHLRNRILVLPVWTPLLKKALKHLRVLTAHQHQKPLIF